MPIFQKRSRSEEALQKLKDVIKLLDGFLEESNFVAGDHLTIADISIIATMSTIEVSVSYKMFLDFLFIQFCRLVE